MSEALIQFRDFSWKYQSQAEPTLRGLSFDVKKGEKVLICGPSGCGKSTIAHCINGLIPFSYRGDISGSLTVCGKETKDLSIFEMSKMVGTVLQDSDGQFVGLTVAEDIAFALENDCVPQSDLIRTVKETASIVSVSDHLRHAPNELSGGQKQRVSLAGVMVDNVPILLFDEPLANLDPATGKRSIALIDEIQKKTGATVIIIEHRLEDVLYRPVDRVILMSEGTIAANMTPDELLSTDLLPKYGIREPLYLTALKYAGIKITPEMHPDSLEHMVLSDEDIKRVKDWYGAGREEGRPAEGEPLLSVKNVSFTYDNGFQALKDVSFEVKKGEMISVVGTNGAGKSTLAKVICGFLRQQQGTIFTHENDGVREECDLSGLSIKEIADHIGYVMQNPNQMISKVMIAEEVALGLTTRKKPEDEITKSVEDTLRICGLYPFRKWPISALSFGQKKRVTIASILSLDPEVIILDEPTAGQDYRHYTEIMEFLRELNDQGVTVLMITHDMHLMLEYCRRAIVVTGGRICADTTPAAVLTDPELVEKASLKETSLYTLALLCGIDDGRAFTEHFISCERQRRGK